MWDYWLDEPHGLCGGGCASPLHGIYAAYAAGPDGRGPPTGSGKALAGLFELRAVLDASLADVAGLLARTSGEAHHLARSGLRHMALELHRFGQIRAYLMGRLDARTRASVSHLEPVLRRVCELSAGIPDPGSGIVRPGSGLFGAAAGAQAPVPDASLLACAALANTFIDGLMHAMPAEFCSSVSGLAAGAFGPGGASGIDERASAHIAQNPVRCLDLGGAGGAAAPIASELVRLRWALRGAAAAYAFTSGLPVGPRGAPWPRGAAQSWRLALHMRHMAVDLHVLATLCDSIRGLGLDPWGSAALAGLRADRAEIARLWALAACWDARGSHAPFTSEVGRGIGTERLLFLSLVASEWAGVNAGHYMSRCAGGAQIPDLPGPARRAGLAAAQREAALYRVRAHAELERRRVAPVAA